MTPIKSLFGLLMLSTILMFCAPSSELSSNLKINSSVPSWYIGAGYSSDSTKVSYYHMSQSLDSLVSRNLAKKVADVELINHIDDRLEDFRTQQNDSQVWQSSEGILELRSAVVQLIGRSEVVQSTTQNVGGYYKNYIHLSLSKRDIVDHLLAIKIFGSSLDAEGVEQLYNTL